ncbi:MAG: ATP-grasp fold amidoligase family protein [Candidatus Aphodomorpha sp.]
MQAVSVDRRDRLLDLASDLVLFLCLFTNVALQHTVWSSAGLLLLFGAAFVRFCVRPRIYGSVWYLGYGLLIVWGLIGALAGWALDRATALSMCKTLLIDLAFVFSVHQLIVQRRDIERSLLVFWAVCLALSAYVLFCERAVLFDNRLGLNAGVNPNDLAMVLSIGYAIAVHRLTVRRRWYEALPILLFAGLILLTGSRKGYLLLVGLPAAYLLWRDRAHLRRNLLILLGCAAVLLAAVFLIPPLYELLGSRLAHMAQALFTADASADGSITERLQFIRVGFDGFLQRPITGWGLDCFRFNGIKRETYSHCNYIELLYGGGLPALLFYYAPLLAVLVRAIRRTGKNAAVQLVTVLTAGYLAMEMFIVTYYERPQLMLIALLLGVCRLALCRGEEDGKAPLKYLKNPFRLFLLPAMRGWFDRMPDKPYLCCLYRAVFGKKLDLLCPRGFNEKLNWMKLYDRDERYVRLADKYAMRAVVQERVGEGHLVPLLGVWSDADAIDFSALPVPCALKTTHDSGGVCLLTSGDAAEREKARTFLKRHLARSYALLWREWPYSRVQPRVIAEAFIGGADGSLPVDYKVQCFDGRAFAVIACTGRGDGKPCYWYFDRSGAPLPVTHFMEAHMDEAKAVLLPSLAEMIRVAEGCSAGFRELRVDLYLAADGSVRVGELTLFDGAGFFEDYTEAGDRLLGEQLRLGEQRYPVDQRNPGDRRYPGGQPDPADRRYPANQPAPDNQPQPAGLSDPGDQRTPGDRRYPGGQPNPGNQPQSAELSDPGDRRYPGDQPDPENQPQPAELSDPVDKSQPGDQPDPGATSEAAHGA